MIKLGKWLLGHLGGFTAQILLALGLSVTTVVGIDLVLNQLKTQLVDQLTGMPPDWLNWMLYLWIGKGIGIVFGALTTKLTMMGVANGARFLGKAP